MTARVHSPWSGLSHRARLLSPTALTAARVALERDAGVRAGRAASAARDRLKQRVRPTRPRMRALTAAAGAPLAWRDVPAPAPPGPDGAIVRPIAAATCDLDRPLALGATPFPLPLGFGHECVAEVLAVGDRVTGPRVGQRVVVPFQISCGRCPSCRTGGTANCGSVPPISMYGFGLAGGHWGGAFSEQLAVPYADAMLVPLGSGIDPVAAASVADNVSDGYRHVGPHAAELLARDPDAEVLIVAGVVPGPGFSPSVALYAGLVARAMGVRRVLLADSRVHVREQADRLGLESMHPRQLSKVPSAPLVVDVSAHPHGLRMALTRTAPDGICSSAGMLHGHARIPVALLYGRNATLHIGRTHARAVIPKVLDLMATGRLKPQAVTTTVASWEEAPSALNAHIRSDEVKTVISV